ncbi:MAG: cyclic pyranopterin phosphate synthase MoaA [Deltaproteobacteria bacterium RBG_16_48_10]|nr:MAG: cyclic pyranopterin phosphate synthase MoaA [Deltaproteobacteria bacterium RBG_16_48_10]
MLLDPYKRKINYLRISVTDRCNLRCRYCMPEEGIPLISHGEVLTYEEILRIVRVFAAEGISKIRLTGGEPLIRKGIVDFISRLSQIKEVKDLSLTTNGILLKELARDLRQAGLNRINISLDSLRKDRFFQITRKDDFERVWSGIEAALEVGLSPIKINMVAIKGLNDDEIESFARLTLHLPLTVRYIEYMPSGNGESWKETDLLTIPQINQRLEKLGPLIPVPSDHWDGPAKRFWINGALGEIGFIGAVSSHFCSDCNRLRLTSDGKIRTCLFSDEEIDVKEILRKGGSDCDLRDRLLAALKAKPEKHHIDSCQFKKCQRNMSAIGG